MNSIFKYLIRSHLFLALCSFIFLVGLQKESSLSWIYALMISMGIIGVYNSHRLWKYGKNRLPGYMKEWTSVNKRSLYFLAIIPTIFAALLYYSFFGGNPTQDLLAVICVLISVFYVKRLGKLSLREIPYMKVIFVILIWYFLFFVFPFMIFDSPQPWLLGFLFLLIILIPSDIKDVYFDPKDMRTIPQIIGLNKSVRVIQLIVLLSILILSFRFEEVNNAPAWIFGFLYFLLLTFTYKKIGYKYFFVFADFTFMLIGITAAFLRFM